MTTPNYKTRMERDAYTIGYEDARQGKIARPRPTSFDFEQLAYLDGYRHGSLVTHAT